MLQLLTNVAEWDLTKRGSKPNTIISMFYSFSSTWYHPVLGLDFFKLPYIICCWIHFHCRTNRTCWQRTVLRSLEEVTLSDNAFCTLKYSRLYFQGKCSWWSSCDIVAVELQGEIWNIYYRISWYSIRPINCTFCPFTFISSGWRSGLSQLQSCGSDTFNST